MIKALRSKGVLSQAILGCGLGLLLGFALKWTSPLTLFAIITAIFVLYVTFKRPEFALLGILVATSSIVFEEQLPLISAGGISLHVPDLFLLSQLGFIVFRRLVEPSFKIIHTRLDWPLLIFYGVTIVSTFIAIFQSSVDVIDARRGIRTISYYLTFFVVTNLVRERRQLDSLLNGLFLLATIVAAGMVAQFLLGSSVIILPGRLDNSLMTQNKIFSDITRIVPPGWSIVLISFAAILCILILEKIKPLGWLKFLQWGLLGIALLFSFLRSYWAALIIVFFLLGYILKGDDRRKLIKWSLVVISSAAIIILVLFSGPSSRATRLIDAAFDRLSTLGKTATFQGQDGSLNWRMAENKYAFSAIASHPLIGLGMGATYRPWDYRLDPVFAGSGYDYQKHIHNGHLWILLDTGFLGYLALMWLSIAFLIHGFRDWRRVGDDRMKGIVLGFTLVYLAVLIAAVANSSFVQWRWTPVFGIIMGINEVILRKFRME